MKIVVSPIESPLLHDFSYIHEIETIKMITLYRCLILFLKKESQQTTMQGIL